LFLLAAGLASTEPIKLSLKRISKETLNDLRNSNEGRAFSQKMKEDPIAVFPDTFAGFVAPITVGTPEQRILAYIDITSSDSELCNTPACFTAFYPEASVSFQKTREPDPSQPRDEGSGKDVAHFGDFQIKDFEFNLVNQPVSFFFLFGSIGLNAFDSNRQNSPSLISRIFSESVLPRNIFSLYIKADFDASELLLGGIDRSKYSGKIEYTPNLIVDGFETWAVEITRVDFAGNIGEETSQAALVTLNENSFEMPPAEAERYYRQINASVVEGSTERRFKCYNYDSLPPVSFKLRNSLTSQVFDISLFALFSLGGSDDECSLKINTTKESDPYSWVLGSPFFERNYVIFDYDRKRIGLAKSVDTS